MMRTVTLLCALLWLPLLAASTPDTAALRRKTTASDPEHYGVERHAHNDTAPRRKTIVVDPGHGGTERGAHSDVAPRYEEKKLALQTALKLKADLELLGYQVLMTRQQDKTTPLHERAAFANHSKGDLFISVHYNSAPSKEAHGVETFYYDDPADRRRSEDSKRFATLALDSIVERTQAHKRKVKHANFLVVREVKNMPSVLVECGFLTNDKELALCQQAAYQKKVSLGIAQAVENYFAQKRIDALALEKK